MRISRQTQMRAVELMTDMTVRQIEVLFTGNDLTARAELLDEREWPVGTSVRRDTAARSHAALNPQDPNTEPRLLRVYDEILEEFGSRADRLASALRRDGVDIEEGRIAAAHLALHDEPELNALLTSYERISDPEVLREHARCRGRSDGRIRRTPCSQHAR